MNDSLQTLRSEARRLVRGKGPHAIRYPARFQTYGVVSGVRGTTVLRDRVKSEDVRQLARYCWIKR